MKIRENEKESTKENKDEWGGKWRVLEANCRVTYLKNVNAAARSSKIGPEN